ncbi:MULTISPECIES: hypothetical protein [unclassified Clostridioides]|uniref:hypothetical protein n=1 Tax=unclassified Clostridioides TaxID=2635829 RepID=UPI001D1260A9|nr:hypothetical protein [Clostridioides sp. ZZV14-6048]MCC0740019.1 hypothetical protein [Clostridioides sp. ZZV14-5902]
MSTRGLIGYRTTKERDTTNNVFGIYNHYDSYFTGKGLDILEIYNNNSKENFIDMFKSKTWESEEICRVEDTLSIFSLNEENLFNQSDFLLDGLFCEYAYIYNIQTDELEVYETIKNKPYFKNQPKDDLNYYLSLAFIVNRKNVFFILNLFYHSLDLGNDTLIKMYMKESKGIINGMK